MAPALLESSIDYVLDFNTFSIFISQISNILTTELSHPSFPSLLAFR